MRSFPLSWLLDCELLQRGTTLDEQELVWLVDDIVDRKRRRVV